MIDTTCWSTFISCALKIVGGGAGCIPGERLRGAAGPLFRQEEAAVAARRALAAGPGQPAGQVGGNYVSSPFQFPFYLFVVSSTSPSAPKPKPQTGENRALAIAAEMEARAKALVAKQEAVVVPVVAAYLPAKEQKRFNNKVRPSVGTCAYIYIWIYECAHKNPIHVR